MKLIIQIPCLNEREHLGETLRDLPRSIPGITSIEVLIIDDGSTDGTSEVAAQLGVHHIVRFPRNRGLAAAHMAGLDAALRIGADIVVNTDADNQYKGSDIHKLVEPILAGQADLVVGDRQTDQIAHFSVLKRTLQRWGSRAVRMASKTSVADSTSGFRAYNRRAALSLFVHNRFSYTLETLIQAGHSGLHVTNAKIGTNPKTRESRLFKSIPDYLKKSGPVILRAYAIYSPVRTFGYLAVLPLLIGFGLCGNFLIRYLQDPSYNGHVQSLLAGVGSILFGFLILLLAVLSSLFATNRRLLEEVLLRVRRLESGSQVGHSVRDVVHTGAAPWI